MNKRINELAEQAANETRMSHNNPYWRMQDGIEEDRVWREKFAELIVKECISLMQNEMQGEDDISSEWVYNKIVEPTKKHFGIE